MTKFIKNILYDSKIFYEIIRSFIAGFLTFVCDYSITLLSKAIFFKNMGVLGSCFATTIGYIIGVFIAYFLSSKFVFKNVQSMSMHSFTLFVIFGIICLGFTFVLTYIAEEIFLIALKWSKFISTTIVSTIGYFLRKYFIFNKVSE